MEKRWRSGSGEQRCENVLIQKGQGSDGGRKEPKSDSGMSSSAFPNVTPPRVADLGAAFANSIIDRINPNNEASVNACASCRKGCGILTVPPSNFRAACHADSD